MAKKASKKVTDSGVEITFESGEVVAVQLDQLSDGIITKLALHGLSQKVGDSYAGAELAEAHELAGSVVKRLIEGEWTQASTGGGVSRVSMLVEALAAATGKTNDEALEVVKGMSEDQKKELKKHPAIAKELATIAAERAVAKAKRAEEAAAASDAPALTL
jgi:hypothetical protein